MTFVPGQVLTAAELNVLDITSLTVDTDTLVVDATNDRVGINQASPSVALDVGGSVVIDDTLAVDTDTLFTNGAGQVGIGTTTPTANHVLHTHGAVLISSTTGVGNSHFPFTDGRFYYTADPETGGTGDHVFRHYSGGSYVEQMRIYENGDVNITGALTPGEIDAFDNTNTVTSSSAKFLFGRSSSQAIAFHGGSSGNFLTSISQTTNEKPFKIQVSKDDGATFGSYTFGTSGLAIGSGAETTYGLLVVASSAFNNGSQILRNWGSGTDIDALLPGSTFGGVLDGNTSGHIVVGIRNNDTADSFSIVSGGTNSGGYTTDDTYDLLVANFRADGNVAIGTSTVVEKFTLEGGGYYSNRSGFSPTVNDDAGIRVSGNWGGGVILSEGSNQVKIYSPGGNQLEIRVGATATTGGTLAFDIASNGQISIPGTFPGVSGYLTVRRRSSDGLLGFASSSQRYKENIVDADDTWRQIYDLRPRDFDWRESMFGDDPDGVPADRSDFGLIAEEANEVMPSIVQWSSPPPPSDDDTDDAEPFVPVVESIDYEKLSTYLLPAIQDLNARVATLESA